MTLRGQPIRSCLMTMFMVVVGVLFTGLTVSPVVANAAPHEKRPNPKQQVEVLEEQWRVAQLAGDIATMDKMLSDDYIGISMTGEVDTKAQQLRRVMDRRLMLSKIELSDMKVKLVGAVAIVTSRARVEGTNDGVSVMGTYRYTRIYRHLTTGRWEITSFEATREHRHRSEAKDEAPAAAMQPGSGQNE